MAKTSDVSTLAEVRQERFDALMWWAVETIRSSSLVTDPEVCARLEEIDGLLGREVDDD